MIAPLLAIRNLTVQFRVDSGWVTAIDDVSLDVDPGDCVGIVGESGSGKSVTALSILRSPVQHSSPSLAHTGEYATYGRTIQSSYPVATRGQGR